ncbi:MAG: hypothetical protein Q9184_007236 [Pyrenodesmia sp. 2 TL-2023]
MLKFLYCTGYNDEDEPLDEEKDGDQCAAAKQTLSQPDDQEPASATPVSTPAVAEKGQGNDGAPEKINTTAITNNVLIYALADKYDISLLKDLAKDKFSARSTLKWDDESLLTVLELVYNTTPSSDQGLRKIISEICSTHINDSFGNLLSNGRFKEIARNDGTLAFDVLVRIHQIKTCVEHSLKNEIQEGSYRAGETIGDLRQKLKSAEQELTNAREGAEAEHDALKRFIKTHKACCNCEQDLEIKTERHARV